MKIKHPIIPICLLACQPKDRKLDTFAWLEGTWQIVDTAYSNYGIQVFEKWEKSGDSAYHGLTYSVNQGDTEILEALQIVNREKDMYYIATVNNQNGGESVPFKMQYATGDSMCFGNTTHDFPKYIHYFKEDNQTITALVSMDKHHYKQLTTDRVKNNPDAISFKLRKTRK